MSNTELLPISFEDDEDDDKTRKDNKHFSMNALKESLLTPSSKGKWRSRSPTPTPSKDSQNSQSKSGSRTPNSTSRSSSTANNNNDNEPNELPQESEPLSFVQVLKLLLEKDRELLLKLNEMIEQIEKHRKNLLIAKTTGVSVAGVGTGVLIGCVIAAPFTLGLSLLPATIFGGTCAATGALTSAGSDIADAVITKKYENVLRVLQDERNTLALELGKCTTNIDRLVHKLVEWGFEKEVAILEVFRCIKEDKLNLAFLENVEEEARIISSNIVGAEKNLNATKTNCSLDSKANLKLAGGIVGASAGVGRIVMAVTPVDKVVNIFFKSGQLIGQGVLQGVGVVVGVAFTVVDIVSVVHTWKNDHPLVPHLKTIVEALQESEEEWKSMLILLENDL